MIPITGKEINIVGRGEGWENAPSDNCWGFNDQLLLRPFDAIFDMHHLPKLLSNQRRVGRRTTQGVWDGVQKVIETNTPM